MVNIPDSLCHRARVLAECDGVPLDQFIATALAEKLAVLDAENLLRSRASQGDRERFEQVLAKVPDVPPAESDRLPHSLP